jgi:uncharacterized membrane protein YeiH
MVRDVLLREIPAVLRTDIYAVAALVGATILVGGRAMSVPQPIASAMGALLCIGIRLGAMHYGWRLPAANPPEPGARETKH